MSLTSKDIELICQQAEKIDVNPDSRRLFHGRGQVYPGLEALCVDKLDQALLITVFDDMDRNWLTDLAGRLAKERDRKNVLLQRRYAATEMLDVLAGELPENMTVTENGLRYRVDPARGRNIGFFMDMAEVRNWLAGKSQGANVLNLFAFSCAFSVVARANGASQVVNIDLSSASLELGRDNHRLNEHSLDGIHFFAHNIFRSWKKLHKYGRYDVVILDPPTRQKGSFDADKDYRKVVKQLSKLCADGGLIVACLNSPFHGPDFITECFAEYLPAAEFVERLETPEAFVDADQAAALKVMVYRYCASD